VPADPAEVGGMHGELSEKLRQTAAKSILNGLMVWLGEHGLGAAAHAAGLRAALDQHAASVRDALGNQAGGPNAVGLAGYAAGVRDALIEIEWRMSPVNELDWSALEWPVLRLLAVCSLARTAGYA
jgi:hypothetical protein